MALTDNLVSYWKLDETSGTREDSHGSNDLSDGNTVTYDTGKINNAASFTAANSEYLYIADASQTGLDPTGSFSISLWTKQGATNGARRHLLARDVAGSRALAIYTDDTQKIIWIINDTTIQISTDALTAGNWYHITFVYTYVASGTSLMDMYINGSSGATQITNAVGPMTNSTGQFCIGRREYSGSEGYFNSLIDEVGYWSKALTSTEVTSLYNGGSGFAYPFSSTTRVHNLGTLGVGT